MNSYSFPGFPVFLKRAAVELERPAAERPAHRIETFTAMANLCAQAGAAHSKDAQSIIDKAIEFRDQLHVAARAADLMLNEVNEAIHADRPMVVSKPNVTAHPRGTRR